MVPFGRRPPRPLTATARRAATHRLADTGALWLGQGGQTFGSHGLDSQLKERAELAGIKGFHLHLLRHTAAIPMAARRGQRDRA